MSTFADYPQYDATGLAELLARGEVGAAELVDAAIERIARDNPTLNAVVFTRFDEARREARAAPRPTPERPFAGVPFVLKDLLTTLSGMPMTRGSRLWRDQVATHDAELTRRYLASGAIVVGTTNTPELGLLPTTEPVAHGPSRNPWDARRTPGGSSGGTAAAVAARFVPFGGGGDGGGSIRIPASCCGLVGLKPTRGRTPTGPDAAEGWHGFAVQHVLARSVRDSARMLDCIAGWYPGDRDYLPPPDKPFASALDAPPRRLRIAFSGEPLLPCQEIHVDCQHGLHKTAKRLEDLGHEVVEAAPRLDGRAFARAYLTMVACHTWAEVTAGEEALGRRARRGDLEPTTWLAHASGAAFSGGQYVAAVATLHRLVRPVHAFLQDYDVLLNPTLAAPPPPLGFLRSKGLPALVEKLAGRIPLGPLLTAGAALDQVAADAFDFVPFTPVYNATGQPSISLPLHWTQEGLPVGMMFTAPFGQEHTLLQLAAQLERAHPWADQLPPDLTRRPL